MNRRQRSLRHHKKITVNALENVPNVLLVEPKELFDSQITSLLAQVFFGGKTTLAGRWRVRSVIFLTFEVH